MENQELIDKLIKDCDTRVAELEAMEATKVVLALIRENQKLAVKLQQLKMKS